MAHLDYKVIDGKAYWGGRTLAEWAPEAARTIVEKFQPTRVIFFGSTVRGEDGPDSDLDFLVVFDHIDGSRRRLAVDILEALKKVGAPVDVMVTDAAEFERRRAVPSIYRVASREGTVLHERAA